MFLAECHSSIIISLWWVRCYESFVCLFRPDIVQEKPHALTIGIMIYFLFVVFSAFVHGKVDIWRQLRMN